MKQLERQGYRLVGAHSAIKICDWTKKALRGEDTCYKHKFYGIQSWRCIQMSCSLQFCTHLCNFCWRDLKYTKPEFNIKPDEPGFIVDNCIKKFKEILQGFGGSRKLNRERFKQSMQPLHFAISLAGESTLYPELSKLITEIRERDMTSFLVSNGTNPEAIKYLIKNQPTQMYITLPAPNEEVYEKTCNPLIENGFRKIKESLRLLEEFRRPVIRMTLVKGLNLGYEDEYAGILNNLDVKYIEVKAGMSVGFAKKRIDYKDMPIYKDILDFANKISELTKLKIIDEKPISRVVLLAKKDYRDRKLNIK